MSEDAAPYEAKPAPEYYYSDHEDCEIWSNEDMQEAANDAWIEAFNTLPLDSPSVGMLVAIFRGESSAINFSELLPDLSEHISEQLWSIAGEAAECTEFDTDLQKRFIAWAQENIPINSFRIINITAIELVFDGKLWVEHES